MNRHFLLTLSLLTTANFAHADEAKNTAPDLPALIECRAQLDDFRALAPALSDPLKAVALGWRPLPQTNQFMSEFELNTPIHVFGYDTDHIAFSGDGIVAVIDLPDPHPLVQQLQLETAFDTPQHAMFGKEIRGIEGVDVQTGTPTYETAVLTVSTVPTHPGKTLAGCSYSIDAMDEEAKPAKSGD